MSEWKEPLTYIEEISGGLQRVVLVEKERKVDDPGTPCLLSPLMASFPLPLWTLEGLGCPKEYVDRMPPPRFLDPSGTCLTLISPRPQPGLRESHAGLSSQSANSPSEQQLPSWFFTFIVFPPWAPSLKEDGTSMVEISLCS